MKSRGAQESTCVLLYRAPLSQLARERLATLRDSTDVAREVYATARSLFDALGLQRARLRLVGVRIEGLAPADRQERQTQLGEPELGWRDAERAVDRASARFGAGSVRPASLVDPESPRR